MKSCAIVYSFHTLSCVQLTFLPVKSGVADVICRVFACRTTATLRETSVPLLCFACFDADFAHVQKSLSLPNSPRNQGLHLVPHVFPQRRRLPAQIEQHQLPQVSVQGDQEGEGLIA